LDIGLTAFKPFPLKVWEVELDQELNAEDVCEKAIAIIQQE